MRLEDLPDAGATEKQFALGAGDREAEKFIRLKATPPTWRDVWAILRGRYEPRVEAHWVLTLKGFDQILRKTWSASDDMKTQMQAHRGFLAQMEAEKKDG